MNVEVAYEKILSSVKRRFDYLQYEEDFIDALGTEKGAMIAANLVRETMIGLADGKKVEDIAADLNAQLACLGLSADTTRYNGNNFFQALPGGLGVIVL